MTKKKRLAVGVQLSAKSYVNPKPWPDESNREGIELMLLHCYEWGVANGYIQPESPRTVSTATTESTNEEA